MQQFDGYKQDVQYVQERLIKAVQFASRLLMNTASSDAQMSENIDGLLDAMERGTITARTILENHCPQIDFEKGKATQNTANDIVGEVEITPEMWVHIKLNTLLPHCKYKTTPYLQDTISRLLKNYPGTFPKYDKVFLAIIEHCNIQNRNAYDQDNKSWKQIPNALKGILFEDDDQFRLSLGLFSIFDDVPACHIYVMPIENVSSFMFSMGENMYGLGR